MQFIDIGVNLSHEGFDVDRAEVVKRAQVAGVTQMVVTGSNPEHSARALGLACEYPGVLFATAGVHPHHAIEYNDECDQQMRALHEQPEVVAVGECGLDYFRDFSPRLAQRFAFERQLQIASDTQKPLFLHQREAHSDFMAMMKNFRGKLSRAVVHCFTGTKAELFDYLDQDWFIGITGWLCDERRGTHLHELVRHIPADRLMIETDAPYLVPRNLRKMPKDRRNEPAFLPHIADELARERGVAIHTIAQQTTAVAREFFALPEQSSALSQYTDMMCFG